MEFIKKIKGLEVWDCTPKNALPTTYKASTSIQVRDYRSFNEGYFLLKQIRYDLGSEEKRDIAIKKAISYAEL